MSVFFLTSFDKLCILKSYSHPNFKSSPCIQSVINSNCAPWDQPDLYCSTYTSKAPKQVRFALMYLKYVLNRKPLGKTEAIRIADNLNRFTLYSQTD